MKTLRFFRWIATLFVTFSFLTSCQNETSTTFPTEPPTPVSPCGDGVCDEVEAADPSLCPQDCPSSSTPPTSPVSSQPNIILILTDDQDAASLDYMPQVQALLADQGTTFTNFLISMPLCCPSRATILRGEYGHSTQIMGNDLPYGGYFKFAELGEEESTCATWLQDADYQTMFVGKYLNAFPDTNDLMHIPPGWDEWYSPMEGVPYTQYDYTLNENGRQVAYGSEPEDYGTDVYARITVDFIQRASQSDQPFFAHVSVYAPHWPTTPASRHADLFQDSQAPRTPNFNEQDVSDKPSYIRDLPLLSDDDVAHIDEEWRQRLRSMQSVDEMVASIVEALESTGQMENTYIFYVSDNGYHLGNHRQMLGKTSPYDEEIRIPMIVRGPGVPIGQTLNHLTGNVDLAPTWADIAGVTPPDFVEGRSLLSLLGEDVPPESEWRQWFLLEHAPFEGPGRSPGSGSVIALGKSRTPAGLLEPPDPEDFHPSGTVAAIESGSEALPYRGLRSLDYLYVEYPTDEKELYDLHKDPYQLENIASSADPTLLELLAARLDQLAVCTGEECRALEDAPLGSSGITPSENSHLVTPSNPLIYYLGYATEENIQWIETFDAEVLTRSFLLFLNSSDTWFSDYEPRMRQLQADGRQFLVALQAAILVEDQEDIPALGQEDPALAFPMDPIPQWQQYACRKPDGSMLKDEGFGFAHACLNNPDFREFFVDKVLNLVNIGADGVHIDELPTRYFAHHEGYCDACMAGFRAYLAEKFTSAELKSLYDIENIAAFDFRSRLAEDDNVQTPPDNPLHQEWWLFQLTNLYQVENEIFATIREHAASQGKEFLITSNVFEPESNPAHILEMTMTDYASIGTGMTIQLRDGGKLISTSRIPPDYSYMPLYRLGQAITPDRPIALFIDGPGGTSLMQGLPIQTQRDIIRWMFAEAYAAGARFHVPYPSLDYYAPLEDSQAYVLFIQDNQEAYQDSEHLVDVGVLYSYASAIWDFWMDASMSGTNHSLQWYGLAQALTDLSIQFDVVFFPDGEVLPDDLTLDDLLRFETLIVPWVYSLCDQHVKLLEDYVRSGKRLMVIGDYANFNENKDQRFTDAAGYLQELGAVIVPNLNFETYLNEPSGSSSAPILDALSDLVPDRLVMVNNNSITAQLNRIGNNLYIHLINTDRQDSGFRSQNDFEVVVEMPEDLVSSTTHAIYLSPDQLNTGSLQLPITRQNKTILVTVPELEVYGVLLISATD
jgi:arylsulfatase A-like enzyme